MKSKMEKLDPSYSSGTITEDATESPNKTLFPSSARGTPRGIAMNPSSGGVHRATASSFVNTIFASQGQSNLRESDGNSDSIACTAAAFVHSIFNPPESSDGRRHSRSKIAPLDFNDDAFDTVSIDDSNSHREGSNRQVLAQ